MPGSKKDNSILSTALALQTERKDVTVTLVSKDINLRIKAAVLGIHAEDYFNDQVLDDVSLLYSGRAELGADFWDNMATGHGFLAGQRPHLLSRTGTAGRGWHPNQCLSLDGSRSMEAMVRSREGDSAVLEVAIDYRKSSHTVWGINARNVDQNFALNLLMDPESISSAWSARPAPARPCWRWRRAWRRCWTTSATPRSS
jgi:PhoH-like ATPase